MIFIAVSCINREGRCLCRGNAVPVKTVDAGTFTCCNCCIKICHKFLKRNPGYFFQILFAAERRSIHGIKFRKHLHRLIASSHPVNNVSYKKIWHSIVLCIIVSIALIDQRRSRTDGGITSNAIQPSTAVCTSPEIIHNSYCKTLIQPHISARTHKSRLQPKNCMLSFMNKKSVTFRHFTGNIG